MKNLNDHIKSDKRVILSTWQTIGHYSFMLVPLIFPAFELFYKLSGKPTVNSFSTTFQLICFLVSLAIGYFKWRELCCYLLEESRSDKEFENAVLASANKLNWRIDNFNNYKVDATSYNPWKSRDSQLIQIERQKSRILISSIIEPGFLSVPDFFGINRRNINTFLNYYNQSNTVENLNEKVIQHLKEEEEKIENEPEWNLKNTLKRLIAYLFCFGFLSLGIAIWNSDGFSFLVLFLCLLGLSYIIFDIYVIWTKRKKASS
jgi:hypothetical protein